jgi:hypothetical protein
MAQVDTELEALQTSATRVQDLVLDIIDGPSSLVVSLSMVAELLEGQIDATTTNGVRWGTRSVFGCRFVTFSGTEDRAGVAWVRA